MAMIRLNQTPRTRNSFIIHLAPSACELGHRPAAAGRSTLGKRKVERVVLNALAKQVAALPPKFKSTWHSRRSSLTSCAFGELSTIVFGEADPPLANARWNALPKASGEHPGKEQKSVPCIQASSSQRLQPIPSPLRSARFRWQRQRNATVALPHLALLDR